MAGQYTALEDAALVKELAVQQRSLVQARFALSMNRLDNTATVRTIRRDIARIRTELRRRELAAGANKDSLVAQHRVDVKSLGGGSESGSAGGLLASVDEKLED